MNPSSDYSASCRTVERSVTIHVVQVLHIITLIAVGEGLTRENGSAK